MSEPRINNPELIRLELENIAASKPFANATRARRFLSYVVEKTLAGEQDSIKEIVLGSEVFDRASDFDPRADTIVRVEAGKLRKRLEQYYEDEGRDRELRIVIPKGTYVPRFEERIAAQAEVGPRRRWWIYAMVAALAAGAAFAFWSRQRDGSRDGEPTIAILPFQNFSAKPENEYLADGLTEDLTDSVARIGGMRVASRTSAFAFKGKRVDIHDVAEKLHAAYLVEGSVRKDGQRIKITAQLIRASDGYHVWSNSFERGIEDVLAVQSDIAEAIAGAVARRLSRAAKPKPYTANVEAFDLYMKGRHAMSAPVLSDIDLAEKLLKQAIGADPTYPLPYVALAGLYLNANIMELRPSRELISKSKAAVERAIALNGNIAEAHAVLGSLAGRNEYDWAKAESHFRTALEIDANSSRAHSMFALDVLAPQGRWAEATTEMRLALELDPLSPTVRVGQPWMDYLQRRYDVAMAGLRPLLAANPGDPAANGAMVSCLAGKRDFVPALELLKRQLAMAPIPMIFANEAYVHAQAGEAAEARKILGRLVRESKGRYISPTVFAFAHMGLNDRDEAFRYLNLAFEDRESFLIFAKVADIFDPIRSDPRFGTLLEKLQLDDSSIERNQRVSRSIHR